MEHRRRLRRSALAVGCGGVAVAVLGPSGDDGARGGEDAAFVSALQPHHLGPRRHASGYAQAQSTQLTEANALPSAPSGTSALTQMVASVVAGSVAVGSTAATSTRRSQKASRTQRRFFQTTIENMNPFKEKPEEETKNRFDPIVKEIRSFEAGYKKMNDDELRAEASTLRARAEKGEGLDDLLPSSFALVREASDRVLGLRHFDSQMMGGIALHKGNVAEMGTGEGKTLVAILPAFLNALAGKGVHVVTVNDYLARRDAEWVGQPLRFLGVTVGVVQGGMTPDQRQKAYRCDVTYVTNSELGFDYLRDQLAPSPGDLGLREQEPFNFAIVDEVDSILIDEARTPLIISGMADQPSNKYMAAREVAKTLRKTVHYEVDEKQRQATLNEEGVEAAEKLLGKADLFDPQDPWFPFVVNALNAKELYTRDKSYIVKKGEVMIVDEFTGRIMDGRRWSGGLHQAVEAKENVKIQPESITLASISYQSLFRLFKKLSGMTGTAYTEAKEFDETYKLKTLVIPPNRTRAREDRDDIVYIDDIGKWKGLAREIENNHRLGRPVLVGTTNVENSEIVAELLDALGVPYRLLNAKPENVTKETEIVAASGRKYAVTIATNMAGRGTDIMLGGNSAMMARLRLRELLYPLLFPKKAKTFAMPDDFYPIDCTQASMEKARAAAKRAAEDWLAKAREAKEQDVDDLEGAEKVAAGEFTLLEAEENLSLACEKSPVEDPAMLQLREAYQAIAGEFKQVTDIEKEEVKALGGLYVLGTERHESRRIDNQLRGRSGRQGDPGQTRFFLSLNDTIFRIFGGDNIKKMVGAMSFSHPDDTPLESSLLSTSLEEAQRKVENYYYSVRKNVFEYDDVMDTQRQIVYKLRRRALLDTDENIMSTVAEFSDRNMEDFLDGHISADKPVADWPLEKLAENCGIYCSLLKDLITVEALKEKAGGGGQDGRDAIGKYLQEKAAESLTKKVDLIEENAPKLSGVVQRQILLNQLDQYWQQHLRNMDFLKTGVTLRAYGQKNPLTEYKLEGYQVFLKMMSRIRRNTVYNVFLFTPRKLSPMSDEKIKSLIPSRGKRRQEMTELKKAAKTNAEAAAAVQMTTAASSSGSQAINLAKLALSVRQLLDAREALKELALASFGELKEQFNRAGLVLPADQLRWAASCKDFQLMEDEVSGEIYVGLKKWSEPHALAGIGASSKEERAEARVALSKAMDDPNFVRTVNEFADRPEDFLVQMKAASEAGGLTPDDVEKMRDLYAASGIDVDQMLEEMSANMEDMPEAQREVVMYMKNMMQKSKDEASQKEPVNESKEEINVD
eukprot:TRINITY_DN110821_c0_g1_i1.p1 TRINITY_DN110821_c0_g1~~TRINITY_DN110821_c0_g1_i1.p1  ORF type:complete len:1309 (-),score=412.50 TRINITY_DN110821_c0_g1_i1:408-4334(-)